MDIEINLCADNEEDEKYTKKNQLYWKDVLFLVRRLVDIVEFCNLHCAVTLVRRYYRAVFRFLSNTHPQPPQGSNLGPSGQAASA